MTTFRRNCHNDLLTISPDPFGSGVPMRLSGSGARGLVSELAQDADGRAALRSLYAGVVGRASICKESHRTVFDGIARRIETGELRVWISPLPSVRIPYPSEGDADPGPPHKPAEPVTTWIEIQVVDSVTNQPVKDVSLVVQPPSGDEAEHATGDNGVVRVDRIPRGSCTVSSKWGGSARGLSLSFAGMGQAQTEGEGQDESAETKTVMLVPKPRLRNPSKPGVGGTKVIVRLERHKVRTGETLAGLAREISTTWKELARFNFGTDKPTEVNHHLHFTLGCRKKDASGKNYVFDDGDTPGILLVPGPWRTTLDAGRRHVVLVSLIDTPAAPPWVFSA